MDEILEIKEGDNFKNRTFLIQKQDTLVILVKRLSVVFQGYRGIAVTWWAGVLLTTMGRTVKGTNAENGRDDLLLSYKLR